MMMFWFAPVLAAWHVAGAAKALFFSFFACLLNWRAFLAYGACHGPAWSLLPLAALSLPLHAARRREAQAGGAGAAAAGLMLPTLFASFYASYRDVFGAGRAGTMRLVKQLAFRR